MKSIAADEDSQKEASMRGAPLNGSTVVPIGDILVVEAQATLVREAYACRILWLAAPPWQARTAAGWDTETVAFATLPNVALPVRCPYCGEVLYWRPSDGWVWPGEKVAH